MGNTGNTGNTGLWMVFHGNLTGLLVQNIIKNNDTVLLNSASSVVSPVPVLFTKCPGKGSARPTDPNTTFALPVQYFLAASSYSQQIAMNKHSRSSPFVTPSRLFLEYDEAPPKYVGTRDTNNM
mmetsp:Transcript_6954/g.13207  ORF Transcript_6954/g.13207 Transcript_6954/m.13207 type:complete len:124 (+) Transcript_6954:133-504(+)